MLHFRARTLSWALPVFSAPGGAAVLETGSRMRKSGWGRAPATLQRVADHLHNTHRPLVGAIVASLVHAPLPGW